MHACVVAETLIAPRAQDQSRASVITGFSAFRAPSGLRRGSRKLCSILFARVPPGGRNLRGELLATEARRENELQQTGTGS